MSQRHLARHRDRLRGHGFPSSCLWLVDLHVLRDRYHVLLSFTFRFAEDTAIHSPPMKRFQKNAVAYGADLLVFELNGEVVSGLPGHHSLENLVLSWARRVVGDDCLEKLLMFF